MTSRTTERKVSPEDGKVRKSPQKPHEALEEERTRSKSLLNQLQYLQADFDNYRKKSEKEIDDKVMHKTLRLLNKIIETKEDIARALSATQKYRQRGQVLEGLEMVRTNIGGVLKEEGVEEILAVDRPFDPHYHEVVSFVERDDLVENTITGEVRKGYTVYGKVLRPSLVEVARKKREVESEIKTG